MSKQKTVCVIGSGISGLTAAYALTKQGYDVSLFEKSFQFGGHTYTYHVTESHNEIAIDMGFIVQNTRNYPRLTKLFSDFDIPQSQIAMSFSYQSSALNFCYHGHSLNQLFCQRKNIIKPSFYRFLFDLLKFNRHAKKALSNPINPNTTLEDWIQDQNLENIKNIIHLKII